jgi:Mn2+/Fe2+ NRAMP family transporter
MMKAKPWVGSRGNKSPPTEGKKSGVLRVLGPGLITGASDDDPSGIATYSQAGAQLGLSIIWTMLFSYPLMAAIQEISARIGRTTGRGIAGNIRRHYPHWLLQSIVGLLLIANMINIGADLGAMGEALASSSAAPTFFMSSSLGCFVPGWKSSSPTNATSKSCGG